MKLQLAGLTVTALCFGYAIAAAAQQTTPSAPADLRVTVDVTQTSEPVSKYLFGSFIEPIGTTISRSMWAELLDDRKFYFPITSRDTQPAGRTQNNPGRTPLRKWGPVGPDEVVTMDTERPFVGEQSPRITLDHATPHGIRQSGFSVVSGKQYTGRIYLRGTPGTKVNVALRWGTGPSDQQIESVGPLTPEYKKFPIKFTSKADSSDTSMDITATGTGDFHVGAVSLMPADNIQGFRPDTIALLRQLHSGMWRLPGGNFLSDWVWYDAIGDVDKRPPMFDYAWNAMQVNDVGMDEFLTFCKLIDVEPYVTVNAGLGDSHSAAEEVEYLNGAASTYMGAKRARNGHPEPYHIKYWNIGNEPWGTFQIGYTDLKYYVLKNNEFAKAMRAADPSITLIASAKMLEPTWLKGEDRAKHVDDLGPMYGSDVDWTGGLLAKSWGTFDGIAQHWYETAGRHFDIQKAKALAPDAAADGANVPYDATTLEFARHAGDVILRHVEEWQGYQKRFPQMVDKKIFMSMDEYSYGGGGGGTGAGGTATGAAPVVGPGNAGNRVPAVAVVAPVAATNRAAGPNLKSVLAYGMMFNEMMRHTDIITIGAHTMGTSSLDITPTSASMNALGLVYQLYGEHFPGLAPVAISGNSPQPQENPAYAEEPKTSSGSPTYPLDMYAAISADRKFVMVAVVNATESQQNFELNVSGVRLSGPSTLWQLTGSSLDAVNKVGEPPQVQVKETSLPAASGKVSVAPISVNVYRFPVASTTR